VRLRVEAAALNRLDLFVVGGLPGVTITPPWVVGSDGAGVVDAVGPGSPPCAPATAWSSTPATAAARATTAGRARTPLCPRYHIFGEHEPGFLAEYAVVPESCVRVRPDHVTARAGGGVLARHAHGVAHGRLAGAGAPGDQVLVLGHRRRRGARGPPDLQARRRPRWGDELEPREARTGAPAGADHLLDHRTQDVPG
jgi:NADPH:quinone reductase-like Zn-dependent oxidoreductase